MTQRMPNATAVERLPWYVRAILGCCAAIVSVAATYFIHPLSGLPLLLTFPMVVLSWWFLGMWGGVFCALTGAILVDKYLTASQAQILTGNPLQLMRLAVFLSISTLLGWAIRWLSNQRAELSRRDFEQQLAIAEAQRQLAEEGARARDALSARDQELQIALRASGLGLWSWDLVRDATYWSDETYRLMGCEPGSIVAGKDAWFQSIHPDDVGRVSSALELTLRDGKEQRRQYRIVLADGSTRWIESQSSCQRDSSGKITRALGVLADITPRKRAEEAMLRAEKLAVAGRLAASVAHEINNPLEAVANLLYLVTLTESAEESKEFAHRALNELLRVSLITQSTLKFHRQLGTPKVTLLSEVLDSIMSLFRGKLLAMEIEPEVRCKQEVGIACMPSEVQQIFANLIGNALEAMPLNGRLIIRLRASLDWRDYQTPGMRVTFFDSGVGMNRATMRRMFEPFFTTKPEIGTGLGMWVVTQLAERHRGHVRAWSRQRSGSSGTAITVFLPVEANERVSEGVMQREVIAGREVTSHLIH